MATTTKREWGVISWEVENTTISTKGKGKGKTVTFFNTTESAISYIPDAINGNTDKRTIRFASCK